VAPPHHEYNPNQYLTLFLLMMFIFGLMFLFPVVLVALELANIVKPAQLLRGWRYAVITITIASAVFTPSGEPLIDGRIGGAARYLLLSRHRRRQTVT